MSKERYAEHTVAWELPNGDSVTKSNYNLADIETKYIPIQTEIISDNKDKTISELQQRIAELEEQLKNAIIAKFKIGQEVWYIEDNQVNSATIDDMWIEFNGGTEHYFNLDLSAGFGLVSKKNDEKWEPHFGIGTYYVFATEEKAQAKLEKLKGENK